MYFYQEGKKHHIVKRYQSREINPRLLILFRESIVIGKAIIRAEKLADGAEFVQVNWEQVETRAAGDRTSKTAEDDLHQQKKRYNVDTAQQMFSFSFCR